MRREQDGRRPVPALGKKAVLGLVAAWLAAGASYAVLAAPVTPAADPYTVLEREVREAIRLEEARVRAGQDPEQVLASPYQILHDIRNHAAFMELWRR